ncbi:unnamed protein product [Lactuca virosa]|uniref:Uncharacterized protein n=1 Tax=Lactuca virosa TaxID=75947 RepID=A0AAU9N5A9_9ASTR|nr:unnamed protein product [Lactuca virosa]
MSNRKKKKKKKPVFKPMSRRPFIPRDHQPTDQEIDIVLSPNFKKRTGCHQPSNIDTEERTVAGCSNVDKKLYRRIAIINWKKKNGQDQRVYNKPEVSQVAALWVEGEENGEHGRRNIQYEHTVTNQRVLSIIMVVMILYNTL